MGPAQDNLLWRITVFRSMKTSSSTVDEQWQSFSLNLGAWEGNLCQYDPDGNVKRRQGSILFIYVDTKDDKLKIENRQPPSVLKMRLHRCGDASDANILYLQGMDLAGRGMVFDPQNGHMCSGGPNLSPVSGAFIEQGLNSFDESGNIVARARMVSRFDAERVQAFSAFRERASSYTNDVPFPEISNTLVESDLIMTDAEASVETLCGTWRGKLTRLQVVGGNIKKSSEDYVKRTSIEGDSLRVEGPFGGSGTISSNRKTVLFSDAGQQWRLVFLGGGVTAMCSLSMPRRGEEFFVELGWLVRHDLRVRTWRKYVGNSWAESCFVEEVRETK